MLALGLAIWAAGASAHVSPSVTGIEQGAPHEAFVPAAPDHSHCFERHHPSCTSGVLMSQVEPLVLARVRRASAVPTDFPAPRSMRLAAPPASASRSILFRNLRE
jgi:hypothetical protein